MKADAYDLSTVFGYDKQLFAPLFQRPYVWEEEKQWKPLWEDIKSIAERLLKNEDDLKPHFLGAIVLEQYKVPVDKPDARSIIDGQQRLTTIQIFLKALKTICNRHDDLTKLGKSIEILIFNDESMVEDNVDKYKVWPTNMDQIPYELVMEAESPDMLRSQIKLNDNAGKSNIVDAFLFFYKAIEEWAVGEGGVRTDKLRAIANTIRKGLHLVVVDMEDEDNAQIIFETLNARGTPLLPSDLVKNFLFHKARQNKMNAEELYESYWEPFDSNHRFWREEITQGRLKRPRIDLLLQHHLTLQTEDEISARALFKEFQNLYSINPNTDPEFFLKPLKKHGEYFKHFLTIPQDSREGVFFHRLKILDTTTVFPLLLGLYESCDDNEYQLDEKISVLVTLESYLIRRMVCRMTTKNYNRFFLDLLSDIMATGQFTLAAIRSFLSKQTSDTNRWPSDGEFHEAWLKVPIYHAITRPRLRMILIALDQGLQDAKTEPYTLKENLTVEHLMPQLWKEHWPLPIINEESFEEMNHRIERRNQLIQSVGNLFYLTKSLNPYVSNGPFEEKKASILGHSAININRIFLRDTDCWNEEDIIKRSEDLFQVASKIWPGPDAQSQEIVKVSAESSFEKSEQDLEEESIQPETAQKGDEKGFFNDAIGVLGQDDINLLRAFYDMAKSSPYDIEWSGEDALVCFEMQYPRLCSGAIIIVYSNGDIEIRFDNIRGSENAELFKEVFSDELIKKMELEIPVELSDGAIKYTSNLWINKGDILMDILDNLLAEYLEIEDF